MSRSLSSLFLVGCVGLVARSSWGQPPVEPPPPADPMVVEEPAAPAEAVVVEEPSAPAEAVVVEEPAAPAEAVVVEEPAAPVEAVVVEEPAAPVEAVVVEEPAAPADASAAVFVVGPRPVEAAPPVDGRLDLTGTYLVSGTGLSRLRLDTNADGRATSGEKYGQRRLLQHRLRFEPVAKLDQGLTIKADVQLMAGYLSVDGPVSGLAGYGPPRSEAAAAFGERQTWRDQLALRQAYLDWRTPVGAVMVGRMVSQWGLGLLANGGEGDLQDWGGVRFGSDRNFGDIVNRFLFATRPLMFATKDAWASRWTLALGADIVERDERIELRLGDFAWQAVGALRYSHEGREAGVYVAYRDLTDRIDDTLEVLAVDLFGKGSWRLGEVELMATGEVAMVSGQTTLARNNAFTGQIDVDQLGYIARGGAKYLPWHVGLDIEVGYASGDSNANDQYLRSFTFDPEYNPSLILFEELRAAESVAAAANASDPARVGYPADSVRLLPTGGAVTNAIYVRPTVRAGLARFLPAEWGEASLRAALLYAVAEEDVVDPVASFLIGGVSVNHQGGPGTERELGLEFDLGLDYALAVSHWAELDLSFQYGRLFPGAAFDNAAGRTHPTVDVWFARLLVRWLPPPASS